MVNKIKTLDEIKKKQDLSIKRKARIKKFKGALGTDVKRFKKEFSKSFLKKKSSKGKAKAIKRFGRLVGPVSNAGGKRKGAGRPDGSYKYGMPVSKWKKLQAQRNAVARVSQQQQINSLMKKGYTLEQINTLQIDKQQKDELSYKKVIANSTVSPNTMAILMDLKRVQNKAQVDDLNKQRIHREQRMVGDAGNLLKARNLFGPDSAKFDIMEMEGNILTAPSVFKESAENNILKQNRPSILNTRMTGNNLAFGGGI